MNRKSLITQSFKKLNFTPREGQEEVVENVLNEFVDNKKRNVILCLDTGAGKSIIAAVIGECLKFYENPKLNSFILMHQNSLTKQYYESFRHMDEKQYFQVRGAGNYPCEYHVYRKNKNTTAEDCVREHLTPIEKDKFCNSCEYKTSRAYINVSDNLITNYSYFFISKMWSSHLEDRNFHVFDEAHLLNDIFCEHAAVHISVERLEAYIKELQNEVNNKCEDEIFHLINFKNDILHKGITESNYHEKISHLYSIYKMIKNKIDSLYSGVTDVSAKSKFAKISKKYFNLGCKIGDFQTYSYEHVFDNTVHNEVTIKPVFIKDMMGSFLSKHNLFMSGTITSNFCSKTFGLETGDTAFVTAEPTFPREHRPVFFIGKKALNYANMQDLETINEIKKSVGYITSFHSKDKGLIMTPSFKLTEQLASSIKGKVFEHKSKQKIVDLIDEFKKYSGPAVLISPSLFEGLDFSGDLSRYQIIVKTPYASLGDKRIKRILDDYPSVYEMNTLFKILQGIGRSTRSKDDFSASYFIDSNSWKLYNSKENIWKNRYEVKT